MTQLIERLEKQGFTVKETRKKHYAVNRGDGPTVFMPSSPSDKRGIHRVVSKLKTIGFDKNC